MNFKNRFKKRFKLKIEFKLKENDLKIEFFKNLKFNIS